MSIIIGICGGSASGKSTFAYELARSLRIENCVIVSLDNYYIDYTIKETSLNRINYDHPDSIDLDLFTSHIKTLNSGQSVDSPRYDFTTHKRLNKTIRITPAKYVLIEGLFLFILPGISNLINIKLFIDTPAELRLQRRIQRDILERNRDQQSILHQYEQQVKPMHIKYVEPNKDLAQLILHGDQAFSEQLSAVHELINRL